MFTVDGHLDLAYNALNFGRNLTLPLATLRAQEAVRPVINGIATVTVPALLEGNVRLVLGSLFAMPLTRRTISYESKVTYDDRLPPAKRQQGAHAIAMQQMDYYRRLVDEDERVLLVRSWADVKRLQNQHKRDKPLLGILVSMEGAEPIREPEEVAMWYELGLRAVGLAWDDTRYAPGQWNGGGKLPPDGMRLLEQMRALNMLVDLTHMAEEATFQVLEMYDGPVVASHSNVRALVPMARQLTDDQIRAIAERGGLIGAVLFNRFLRPGQMVGDPKENVTLAQVVAHIDHMCQLVGNADHVGLGTDWDGGFGSADIPTPLDSAADLPQVADALLAYGYDESDVAKIMGGNWLRVLRAVLDHK